MKALIALTVGLLAATTAAVILWGEEAGLQPAPAPIPPPPDGTGDYNNPPKPFFTYVDKYSGQTVTVWTCKVWSWTVDGNGNIVRP